MRTILETGMILMLFASAFWGCGGPQQPAATSSDGKTAEVRQPVDNVGYTHKSDGIGKVIAQAEKLEEDLIRENQAKLGLGPDTGFVAAIAPHDDYAYASRVYVHALSRIKARHVLLIGVAHKARDFPDIENRLVFDAFKAWHGPYGNVAVSPLREEILKRLPAGDVIVKNEFVSVEHSLEALVPWLQHYDREVEIVPILVPYMPFDRLSALARDAAKAVDEAMKAMGLTLGKDVAILISSDAVHYGDQDWNGRNSADFGTNGAGYDQAVARDHTLIADHLANDLSVEKLEGLFHKLVQDDVHEYRITWCGRFSIPFGLSLLMDLAGIEKTPLPQGHLLRYGTTLDPGRSDPGVSGLGVTAPANLHHWVGFASIGYW